MATPGRIRAGAAFIELALHDDEFKKQWGQLQTRISKINGILSKAGSAAIAFGGAISFAFGRMAMGAADAETGFRRFALIFGSSADEMRDKLRGISSDTGIAMTSLVRQSSAFGAIFSELGEQLGPEQFTAIVAKAQRAVIDLSGIAGITTEEAADRIKSALTSTGESVDQYGFNLRQAEINQELMRLGINKNVRQLTELEKQLVKIMIIQKSIERGQLSFTNMTGTLNAKIAQLRSNLEELGNTLSRYLLPVLKVIVTVFNLLVRLLNWGPFARLMSVMGLLVSAIGVNLVVVGALALSFAALAGAVSFVVTSLSTVGAVITSMGGATAAATTVLAGFTAGFAALGTAIAAAVSELFLLLSVLWPVLAVLAAVAAAIAAIAYFGVYPGIQALNRAEAAETTAGNIWWFIKKIGRPFGVPKSIGEGWNALFGDGAVKAEPKAVQAMTRPTAGSTQSILGSRMIAQQLQYGTGITTPAEETARQVSHLVEIAERVTGDDSVRTEAGS